MNSPAWSQGGVALTDGRLVFHRGGAGQSLIMLHGLTDNGLCWRRTANALATDFDVILVDGRGHGSSPLPAGGGDIDPARDVAELIAALDLQKPVVMGHSVGGSAVAVFGSAHPLLPAKLVLEDPVFRESTPTAADTERLAAFRRQVEAYRNMSIAEIVALGRKQHPQWHADEFADWAAANHQVDPEVVARLRFTPWLEQVRGIRVPTLLVHGDGSHGGIVTEAVAAQVCSVNPLVRSVCIEGAGHNVRRENFAAYLRAIRQFLGAAV